MWSHNFDNTLYRDKFILTTDASNKGIGAILTQIQDVQEKLVALISALHKPAKRNYSTTEHELLAVIKSLEYFRDYLLLRKFTLKTDHKTI